MSVQLRPSGAGTDRPVLVLAAIYLVTMVLTELLSNAAAAALMFPFALAIAGQLGVSPRPFAITIMFAGVATGVRNDAAAAMHTVMSTGRGETSSWAAADTAIGITISAVAVLLIICPNATVTATSTVASATCTIAMRQSGSVTWWPKMRIVPRLRETIT